MSRVLLFVQHGDARPKCVGRTGPLGQIPWTRCPVWLKASRAEYGLSAMQQHEVEAADRWWLVAAANAEDGRFVIECDREAGGVLRDHFASDGKRIYGRVLASGGRP